jgi:hypothetical protein
LFFIRNVVTLEDGQELAFTHCIVAVGSLGPSPARSEQVYQKNVWSDSKTLIGGLPVIFIHLEHGA